MTSKPILIFGCHGQDGSLLCSSILKQGYKPIGLSRNGKTISKNHIHLGIEKDIELRSGDIKDFNKISNIIETYQPLAIYNLAGQSSVGKSFSDPKETIESIVNGTLNILEVARKISYPGRMFFAGSSEMFGETKQGADINHIQKPISPYAIGKQASFNLVKLYREIYNLKCVTGVLFNHESDLRDKSFVTHKIIQGALAIKKQKDHRKMKLGNIKVVRDWGWAPEYVEAMQLITNAQHLKDYVICSGKTNTLELFISKVFSNIGLNWKEYIEIDKNLFRPNEITKSYGNPESLFKDLGWKAKLDIDMIIQKLIDLSPKS